MCKIISHSDNVLVALMYRFIFFFFTDIHKYFFLGVMCPIISRNISSGASKPCVLQKSPVNLAELDSRLRAGIAWESFLCARGSTHVQLNPIRTTYSFCPLLKNLQTTHTWNFLTLALPCTSACTSLLSPPPFTQEGMLRKYETYLKPVMESIVRNKAHFLLPPVWPRYGFSQLMVNIFF